MRFLAEKDTKKGFTLIEMMVVTLLFVFIILASYTVMNSAQRSWHAGDAKIDMQETFRRVMDLMVLELSECAVIDSSYTPLVTVPAGGTSVTFQVPVDINGTGSWEDTDGNMVNDFYFADSLLAAGNVRWGAYLRSEDRGLANGARAGRRIRYLLVGDELIRRILSPAGVTVEDVVLCDNVGGLQIGRTAQDTLTLTLTGSKQSLSQRQVLFTLTSRVHLKSVE
ncbi:type II secretion system protein J [Candidatus Omnitrophota bacterium]